MIIDYLVITLLWGSIIAYAVFGGADFGAGFWHLLATGPQAERQRALIERALNTVWEANSVWLVYLVVGLFVAFPPVAYTLAIAFFVPFILVLLGIVMRGAAFAFQTHFGSMVTVRRVWVSIFSAASTVTPLLLGAIAGAIASGQIRYHHGMVQADRWLPWLRPFSLSIGFTAIAFCATISAVYLTVEAQFAHDAMMMSAFRLRGLVAGAIMALLAFVALFLTPSQAPGLWQGLTHQGLLPLLLTMLVGIGTAIFLLLRRYQAARITIVTMAVGLFGTWGLAQNPYLVPPDLTLSNAASPQTTLTDFFITALIGMAIVIPSLWFLFWVFKSHRTIGTVHGRSLDEAH